MAVLPRTGSICYAIAGGALYQRRARVDELKSQLFRLLDACLVDPSSSPFQTPEFTDHQVPISTTASGKSLRQYLGLHVPIAEEHRHKTAFMMPLPAVALRGRTTRNKIFIQWRGMSCEPTQSDSLNLFSDLQIESLLSDRTATRSHCSVARETRIG
eukprot:3771908-Rhodomonas_salina.1